MSPQYILRILQDRIIQINRQCNYKIKIYYFMVKISKIQSESSLMSLTNIKMNDHEDAGP
jgi:hypothetical protein